MSNSFLQKFPQSTYGTLLHLPVADGHLTAILSVVYDGAGNPLPLLVSNNSIKLDQTTFFDGGIIFKNIGGTTTPPSGSSSLYVRNIDNHMILVKSDGTEIDLNSGAGVTLAGLSDVNLTSLQDGDVLLYDSGTSKWINVDISTLIPQDTDDLPEGSINFYYTTARFNTSFATKTTDNLTEGSTNKYYTDERTDDRVATLIQNGTGISWSYNDGANTLTPTVTLAPFSTTNLSEGASLYYTDERVDDRVSVLIQNGTGITWVYNDGAGTLTPTITITQYTDELAQDAVGGILTDTSTIDFTYNDAGNQITADVKNGSITSTHVDSTVTTNAFKTIQVSGQSDVVADSASDILTLVVSGGLTITTNATTDTITFTNTITQYTDELAQDATGAMATNGTFVNLVYNDGANTLTPNLSATGTPDGTTFLRGDNVWATPTGTTFDYGKTYAMASGAFSS